MYIGSCISLIKVWPQKCLFLGFLTCLEWQYHNNNLAWWGFLLRKSSTFFSSLPSLSLSARYMTSVYSTSGEVPFWKQKYHHKKPSSRMQWMFCLYESRKKLQIGSFLERKIGGGVRKKERVNSTEKMYFYNLHQSKVWMQHLEKKPYKREGRM